MLVTKFAKGAWIVVLAMPIISAGDARHQPALRRGRQELTPSDDAAFSLPANNHALVLVSKLHLPTLRAIGYASATRPSTLEAVTVNLDDADVAPEGGVGRARSRCR